MADENANDAKAIIEGGAIVIRVPIANLQAIMDGGFACAAYAQRWKVRNPDLFAKEIADELNDEDEEGSTAVHKLFDSAINQAIERGAQWVEEHETKEF